MENDMDVKELNELIEDLHDKPIPNKEDDEDEYAAYVESLKTLSMAMPPYKDTTRVDIEEFPSLTGAFGKLFLKLEDSYHKLAEKGAEGKQDPEEIIREHAFDISIAIHEYVINAMVDVEVTTVTTGTVSGVFTTGQGTGLGSGKLS